jgi:hypothetical protein
MSQFYDVFRYKDELTPVPLSSQHVACTIIESHKQYLCRKDNTVDLFLCESLRIHPTLCPELVLTIKHFSDHILSSSSQAHMQLAIMQKEKTNILVADNTARKQIAEYKEVFKTTQETLHLKIMHDSYDNCEYFFNMEQSLIGSLLTLTDIRRKFRQRKHQLHLDTLHGLGVYNGVVKMNIKRYIDTIRHKRY